MTLKQYLRSYKDKKRYDPIRKTIDHNVEILFVIQDALTNF